MRAKQRGVEVAQLVEDEMRAVSANKGAQDDGVIELAAQERLQRRRRREGECACDGKWKKLSLRRRYEERRRRRGRSEPHRALYPCETLAQPRCLSAFPRSATPQIAQRTRVSRSRFELRFNAGTPCRLAVATLVNSSRMRPRSFHVFFETRQKGMASTTLELPNRADPESGPRNISVAT